MRWILSKIASIATWGFIFLIILTVGLNIRFGDIVSIAHSGKPNLNYICLYLALSPLFSIVFNILASFGAENGFFYSLFVRHWQFLKHPWGGVAAIVLRQKYKDTEIDYGDDTSSELEIALGSLFGTIVWWVVFVFCANTIRKTSGNVILKTIKAIPRAELLQTIMIIIVVYLVVYFVVKLIAISLIRSRYGTYS